MHTFKRLELLMEMIPIRCDIYSGRTSIIAKKKSEKKSKAGNYF